MKRLFSFGLAAVTSLVLGCGTSGSTGASSDAGADAADAGGRTYTLVVPTTYTPAPTPLVIMLHGYGVYGALEDNYMHLSAEAEAKGFLYVYADGTVDSNGARFWNATDGCCNFDGSKVDDVAFIDSIIDAVSAQYMVDPKRVFLIGHSNGGFMAHRYACDRAERVAAIVALAGDNWNDPSKCNPSEPVAVAQVHGTKDDTIPYAGGTSGAGTIPSAHASMATWAAKDSCGTPLAKTGTLDLDTELAGAETTVEAYGGCATGGAAELWTIDGGTHIPNLAPGWGDAVWAFLSAHPKP